MRASDLGEFGLIDRLARLASARGGSAFGGGQKPPSLLIGIGDDAAAWRTADGTVLLATTDTLLADVHFLPDRTPWRDLGWKALAVNVSDIAAMGGVPDFALVTLGIPADLPLSAVDDLYAGLLEGAEAYGVAVGGGDVVRSDKAMLTVALLGHAQMDSRGEPLLLRRDAARADQAVAVTGTLGDSAAGLRLLRQGRPADHPLVRAHLHPQPPLAAAQEAARLGLSCAIDISDGLLQDLGHVCQRSPDPIGAVVEADRLPLNDALASAFPDDALALAAGGGEDYQLLLIAPAALLDGLRAVVDLPLTVIGAMVEDPQRRVRLLDAQGADLTPAVAGWDHLRPGGPPSGHQA